MYHPRKTGTPIGFLSSGSQQQSGVSNPYPNPSPFGGGFSQPYMGGGGSFPGAPSPTRRPPALGGIPGGSIPGGSIPGGSIPDGSNPGGGITGMLQGLLGGVSNLNIPSMITNAQKWIGVINQAGSVMKNIGPMLQAVQGLTSINNSNNDTLSEHTQNKPVRKNKKRKKSKRKRHKQAQRKKSLTTRQRKRYKRRS